MKTPFLLSLLLMLFPLGLLAQVNLSGYVYDASNGEQLGRASLSVPSQHIGTYSNDFGYFSLQVPTGAVGLQIRYAGYEPQSHSLSLQQDSLLRIGLVPYSLETVTIVGEQQESPETQTEMSTVDIPLRQIKTMPTLLGEVDVIRAIQLMPGVQAGSEANTGLYVRGGGPDQNLILLDGAPLYYVSHLGGLFSVFNADALQQVKLVKGGFPARYGERLSSVLDIRMKEGNLKEWEGAGSLGLLASRFSLQGPLIRDKASIMVSARRTYLDLFSRPISWFISDQESSFGYQFTDFNAKANYIFSDKDRLYFSTYLGDDVFGVDLDAVSGTRGQADYSRERLNSDLKWGNRLYAVRWNHIWGPRLFSNVSATHTYYRFRLENDAFFEDSELSSRAYVGYESAIRDLGLKADFDFYPHPRHQVKFGWQGSHLIYAPGISSLVFAANDSIQIDTSLGNQRQSPWQNALYLEDEWRPTDQISFNAGVRAVHFYTNGKPYFSVQPRFSGRYQFHPQIAAKASFAAMTQYLHLLTNSGLGVPSDLWVPATEQIGPQQSWQVAIGLAGSIWNHQLEISLEGYYKEMSGLISYAAGASPFSGGTEWQNKVVTEGQGTAYGVELLLQKKFGATSGWLGYTLSWNQRQFDALNFGNWFPYKYDRRHDLSLVLSHRFNERISVSGTWVYGTGNAITLATGAYNSYNGDVGLFRVYSPGNNVIEVYGNGRNDYRMPPYHRLDLGIQFTKVKKWGERTWNFSIYNTYSRRNPYFFYFDTRTRYENGDFSKPITESTLKQVSLFPVLPSISYAFKF